MVNTHITEKNIDRGSSKKNSIFFIFLTATLSIMMLVAVAGFVTITAASVYALADTTPPKILSVSPMNNEKSISTDEPITVQFSEDMNPSTINGNTFTVMQRSTPESGTFRSLDIENSVQYASRTATFTADEVFSPNQEYGNVFTVTITTGAEDLAGNGLSQEYTWSFTTGGDKFNTGDTTSQSNQSANGSTPAVVPVTTPAQPPVTGAPITTLRTATASEFPWEWIAGGAFLLLVAAVIFGLAAKPSRTKSRDDTKNARPTPFGDVHAVRKIEGIGPVYSKALQNMGIKNTQQLWEADAARVSRNTGAPLTTVKSWQHMAELSSVKNIGPQYAELLERSGVHTITQLSNSDPGKLLKLVQEKQDSLDMSIVGSSPGQTTVENWIEGARDHKFIGYEEQTA
ncbi:TPA: DUF4332 domain-containing protein [Candidatus Woesearchaeota archaeon]|nr:DUF4332 domain-containing protein [Candidatus Woesearchaeota archaeon]